MKEIVARINAGEPLPPELEAESETSTVDACVYFESLRLHLIDHMKGHPKSFDGVFSALVQMAAQMAIRTYDMSAEDFAAFAFACATGQA